jgi:hypothetical protein
MSYVRRTIDEMTTRFGGAIKLARTDLGITAFGCQIFELPPPESMRLPRAGTRGLTYLCVGASAGEMYRPNPKFA